MYLPLTSIDEVVTSSLKDTIRILHVDDDPSILEISKKILSEMDNKFDIEFAHSVNEAIQKLSNGNNYDIIISDYDMPRKNGLDFLKELKEKKAKTPFILFTGKGREEIAIKALNLGADGYYNKQGDPETVYGELKHGIQRAIEHKEIQKKLEISQEKFSKIFKNTPNAVSITRLSDSKIIDVNDSTTDILGYYPKEVVGKTTLELNVWVNPNDRKAFVKELLEKGYVSNKELLLRRKDSKEITVNCSGSLIEIESEQCIILSFFDITERKRAEQALAESENKYREIANLLPGIVFELDEKGTITFSNQKALELLNYTKQELEQGMNGFSIIAPEERERAIANTKKVMDGHLFPYNSYTFVRKDGTRFPVSMNSLPIIKEGKARGIRGVAIDMTEHFNYEKALEEIQERCSRLAEASFEGIVLTSGGVILDANKQCAKMLGVELSELIGRKVEEFVAPESRELVRAKILEGSEGPYEHLALKEDGTVFPVEVRAKPVDFKGKKARVTAIFDITERKMAEDDLRKSHRGLKIMNEKLQVIGSLTRHDVKNKHAAIIGNTYLLKKRVNNNPELLKYIEAIELAVSQSGKIFEFSRLYENIGAEQLSQMYVEEAFNQALTLVPHSNVEIVNKIRGLSVLADSMLRQLFYNLLDNSLKHGKSVSKIELSFAIKESAIVLVYKDNGVGVPQELKEKIFSGFSSGGSGFGLKLIKKMMEAYGWSIIETGIEGKGVRFEITIPNEFLNN